MRLLMKKNGGYTLMELLMYVALLGLVMSFIAMVFRHMLWRDRLEELLDDHVKLKQATDLICESVKNAAEIIKPQTGTLSSKIVIRKNDGSFEKIGMYHVGNNLAFIVRRGRSLDELEILSDAETRDHVFSKYVKNIYFARPFYNHIVLKAVSERNFSVIAVNADSVDMASRVLIVKDFGRGYSEEFKHANRLIDVSDDFISKYAQIKKSYEETALSPENVRKFLNAFDSESKSKNILASRAKLREFISEKNCNQVGKILFYTAGLIEKMSNEVSIAASRKKIIVADKDVQGVAENIFGRDIIYGYESYMNKLSAHNLPGLTLKPDYGGLLFEIKRVCDYNRSSLITDLGLAAPYTGSLNDDVGNQINVLNLYYGKTVPLSINDVNIFSELEACPEFNSPQSVFGSIYEIIDSKLAWLSNEKTLIQNIDVLCYCYKNIKKVTAYDSKIDILDHKIKFQILVEYASDVKELSFFVKNAMNSAFIEFPELFKNIPIPASAK